MPKPLRSAWLALTEVPGWPDAPFRTRLLRLLPILAPCLGILALTGWRMVVHDPEVMATREQYASLIELQQQIESLSLACSEQEARELGENAVRALQLFALEPDQIRSALAEFTRQSRALGWEGSFQAFDVEGNDDGTGENLRFIPVLGKMAPVAARPDNFSNLIQITELVFKSPVRMDLTRLQVRAYEETGPAVELGIRVGTLDSDEKAAE